MSGPRNNDGRWVRPLDAGLSRKSPKTIPRPTSECSPWAPIDKKLSHLQAQASAKIPILLNTPTHNQPNTHLSSSLHSKDRQRWQREPQFTHLGLSLTGNIGDHLSRGSQKQNSKTVVTRVYATAVINKISLVTDAKTSSYRICWWRKRI